MARDYTLCQKKIKCPRFGRLYVLTTRKLLICLIPHFGPGIAAAYYAEAVGQLEPRVSYPGIESR